MIMDRKTERRAEIERLRRDGAAAFEAGRSQLPRGMSGTMDAHHWVTGYNDAKEMARLNIKNSLSAQIEAIETIDDVKAVLRELFERSQS
jgi:hypothetical protein